MDEDFDEEEYSDSDESDFEFVKENVKHNYIPVEEIQGSVFCTSCGEEVGRVLTKPSKTTKKTTNDRLKSFSKLVRKVRDRVDIEKHVEKLEEDFELLERGFTSSRPFFNLHFVLSKLLERRGVHVKVFELRVPKKNHVYEFNNLVRDHGLSSSVCNM